MSSAAQKPKDEAPGSYVSESETLFKDHGVAKENMGRSDTLKFGILSYVINEDYEKALTLLERFLEQDSPYPDLRGKIERFVSHSIDLVRAIKTKRNFPGISSLTRAKQQELREKFREHLKELEYALNKIEKVQTDLRIHDARSTIWIVRAIFYSLLVGFLIMVYTHLVGGTGQSINYLIDDNLTKILKMIF